MKGRLEIGWKLFKLDRLVDFFFFFQTWGNGSSSEGCRDRFSVERRVNNGRNEGDQRREAGLNKLSG